MANLMWVTPHVECGQSELVYDSPRLVQNEIDHDYWAYLMPKNTIIQGNPIMFEIEAGSDFIDLSQSTLKVRVKLTLENGDPITAESKCSPVNNTLHSMFQQITVSLKDTVISQANNCYSYRAYLENLLNYSSSAKHSWMKAFGWEDDVAGRFDLETNPAFAKRRTPFLNGGVLELKGRLHCDIAFQPRLIPSNLDVRIVLTPSAPEFCIQSFDEGEKYKLVIESAILCVRKVKLTPSKQIQFERVIARSPARIPINYIHMKTCSIAAGLTSYAQDSIFSGPLPNYIFLAMVDNAAFSGKYSANPFNFKNYDLRTLVLNFNGRSIPSRPLTPNFGRGHYLDCYETLFRSMGTYYSDGDNGISLELYANGSTIYGFNLGSDNCAHNDGLISGNIDVNIRFGAPLAQTITMVLYAQFSNTIRIDQHRNVLTDVTV